MKWLLKKHGLNKFIKTYQNSLAILNKYINLNLTSLKVTIMKVVNIINQLYLRMSIVKINLKVLSIGQCIKIQKLLKNIIT
jgi:hypothetical protein